MSGEHSTSHPAPTNKETTGKNSTQNSNKNGKTQQQSGANPQDLEMEEEPWKRSVLDFVREEYEKYAHLRCTRVSYVGTFKNELNKQAILEIHKEYIETQTQNPNITGILLFINNRYFFHCIEVKSLESVQTLFKTLLCDVNIAQTQRDRNTLQRRLSKNQHPSRSTLRQKSSLLQPTIGMSRQTTNDDIDNNSTSNSQQSANMTGRTSAATLDVPSQQQQQQQQSSNNNNNNNNIHPMAHLADNNGFYDLNNVLYGKNELEQSGICCKICNIVEEIPREFPIWSYRDVSIKCETDNGADSSTNNKENRSNLGNPGGTSSSNNNNNSNNNNGQNGEEEIDFDALKEEEGPLFELMSEMVKSIVELGRQLNSKEDSDGANRLFNSTQREIMKKFPKPDTIEQMLNSHLLFDLKHFYQSFFLPWNFNLESEYTWPVEPIEKF